MLVALATSLSACASPPEPATPQALPGPSAPAEDGARSRDEPTGVARAADAATPGANVPSANVAPPTAGSPPTPSTPAAASEANPAASPAEPPSPPPPPAPPPKAAPVDLTPLLATGGTTLKSVLASPAQYRFQVLYGAIVTKNGKPTLERRTYRADAEYFFPASSMKMPIALATMHRLAALRASKQAITTGATIRFAPTTAIAEPWTTTLSRELRRALVISDNYSANRLLGFTGHREAHEELWGLGLASTRIHTGFATGADMDPATVSPAIDVLDNGAVVTKLPARKSTLVLPKTDAKSLGLGAAYIENGRRIEGPMSFAEKNAIKIRDLQDTLVRIMRPELLPASKAKLEPIADADLEELQKTLGTLPSESGIAGYDRNVVADYPLLPFLRGLERVKPRSKIAIHSKVGQAYGFLIHNAYVVDKESGRAFFLTAVVFANQDGVMNNDKYGYDTIAFPALADVAEVVARDAFAP